MAGYATYADAVALLGEDSIRGSLPKQSAAPETVWLDRLLSASSDVDMVLQRTGYTVPVDFTAVPLPESLARLQAKLKSITIALAWYDALTLGNAAPSEALKQRLEDDHGWMLNVREGRVTLNIPRSKESMGVADNSSTQVPLLDSTVFSTMRSFIGGGCC